MYVCVCMYVRIYVCMYLCIYVLCIYVLCMYVCTRMYGLGTPVDGCLLTVWSVFQTTISILRFIKLLYVTQLHIFQYHNFRLLCVALLGTNAKSPIHSPLLSVRPSASISAAPAGRISLKFDTGDSYEHLSRKSKFG